MFKERPAKKITERYKTVCSRESSIKKYNEVQTARSYISEELLREICGE